ncbi:hypothetical protein FOA52_003537 [Chlamydomonas sp. UWO 241]|nr:hypothetical protein FOA52_003537 [Chlamydomonas sp. UWO 241]
MGHDEDLYGGYDEGSNPLQSTGAYQALGSDAVMPPGTAMQGGGYPPGTAMKSYVAPGTAARNGTETARPMTSVKGAGYSSTQNRKYNPMNGAPSSGTGAKLLKKGEQGSPEEIAIEMEKKVHLLLEESAVLNAKADYSGGLEKAMEAKKRERNLTKYREANNLSESVNIELMYATEVHLAVCFHANKDHQEALDHFTSIVKNPAYKASAGSTSLSPGQLRVNMGNIYFEQKKYSSAIKMYRMALDQIPMTTKEIRFKIERNIGLAFVRMGQYQDAHQHFSTVMDSVPDHQTGYNLIVCSYALGSVEGMKTAFLRLLEVPNVEQEEDDDDILDDDEEEDINRVVQDDGLRDMIRKRQHYVSGVIVQSAQLISERIDSRGGFEAGFDWCIQELRGAGLAKLANEVLLAKASRFLSNKDFESAVAIYKEFEKKSARIKAKAATNLAFLYGLEGDVDQSDKYSELALKSDRYNARAYVNKANVLMEKGDFEGARTLYVEAAGIEPYCVEAIFNLGLLNIKEEEVQGALASFKKLHAMLPDNTEVICQIATCYDILGDFKNSVKWFEMLSSLVPNDPGVLGKLGAIHARFDDEIKALHFYQEAHRVFPVNMDVISWLGAYHVKNEVYEKAVPYFDLASRIQPQEVKWGLMVASCYRRIGAYPQALQKYKEIHIIHPDNVECLRYLVHLCTELGRRDDAQDFITKLRKAEKGAQAEQTAQATRMANAPAQGSGMGGGGMGGAPADAGPDMAGMGPGSRGKKVVEKQGGGDDDWGNEELGDDLLPM